MFVKLLDFSVLDSCIVVIIIIITIIIIIIIIIIIVIIIIIKPYQDLSAGFNRNLSLANAVW